MKKCGKEVRFFPADNGDVTRNGEGSFARLKDGGILYAYTAYYTVNYHDNAPAHIRGVISYDEGETFSEPFVLLEKPENAQNIMSPSLLRMKNGDLGMLVLQKTGDFSADIWCMPYFCSSKDEGKTWSDLKSITIEKGYYCGVNDMMCSDETGRVYIALSYHGLHYQYGKEFITKPGAPKGAAIRVIYSDDCVQWHLCEGEIRSPYHDPHGFAEPGVLKLPDGRLWCWFRTTYGNQYNSYSSDNGKTWTAPAPNFLFTSPDAPMRVKRLGDRTVAVFNPNPYTVMTTKEESWNSAKRTPLVCSVSYDGGQSFDTTDKILTGHLMGPFINHSFLVETDDSNSYCYPSIMDTKDGLLIAYYHSGGHPCPLKSAKITKVYFDEFESKA